MLKSLSSYGSHIVVQGGYPPSTYPSTYSGGLSAGNVRYNTTNQQLEVYDGYNWTQIAMGNPAIALSHDADRAIDWALAKIKEEQELEELAKVNPTIADLCDQMKEIKNKIKMVQILMKEEEKIATN